MPIVDEKVPDNDKPIVIIDKDKEFRSSVIELMIKHDVFPDSMKQSVDYMMWNYVKSAAFGMLNSRFVEASQKADCPFVSASADDDTYILSKTKDAFGLSVSPKDISQCAASLREAFKVVRQAAKFGFTPTEYKRFQTDMLSSLDKEYSNKDKRYNLSLIHI